MFGVVPAAGRGRRLRPLTDDQPKALLEVAGRPILSFVFETLAPHVDAYAVVVGYLGEQIRDRFGDAYDGRPITYVEQPARRGLAHAVRQTESVVDGSFVQLNGDNVLRGNVGDVVEAHLEADAGATLLVDRVDRDRASRGGVLTFDDEDLTGIVEKPDEPPSRLVTTGCFAFSPRVFEACRAIAPSERGEYELADAVEWLLEVGETVETVRFDGWRVNVNTRADLARTEERL